MVAKIKRSFIPKVLISFVLMFILFQPFSAFAEYEPILDKESAESAEKPGIIEKNLAKLFMNVGNWLIDVSNAQDVSVLVFQDPSIVTGDDSIMSNTSSANRSNMIFGIFPKGLFDGIADFYDFFSSLLPIPMVVLITGLGLMLLLDVMKSNEVRSKVKEVLLGVIATILLVRFGVFVWSWIIDINYWMVDAIQGVLKNQGIKVTRFTETIWSSSDYEELTTAQGLGTSLLIIVAVFMTFVINYQYMMRLIQLSMLVVLFPIAALSAMMPSRKSVLNTWFSTFTSNVFMQASHAIALGVFFFALTAAPEIGFWLVMAMLFGLPMMAEVVNRIVGGMTGEGGSGGGVVGAAKGMSGVAGLMAIGKIGSTLTGGKNGKGSNQTNEKSQGSDKTEMGREGSSSDTATHDSSNMGIAQSSAPTGSGLSDSNQLADTRMGRSMNTGIRSRLTSGASSVAKGLAKGGRAFAQSDLANKAVKTSAVLGMAGAGAIASTMTTGSGNVGAVVGTQLGKPIARTGNFIRQKVGKGAEQLGEYTSGVLDMKQGKVDNPHQYTNERLGYTDPSQLYDSEEMGRMGRELIGGRSGEVIGSAVGTISKKTIETFGSAEQKQVAARVGEKRSLGEQIQYSKQMEGSSKEALEASRAEFNHINTQYGSHTPAGQQWKSEKIFEADKALQQHQANPNDQKAYYRHLEAKEATQKPHPKVQEAQKNLHHHEAVHSQHSYNTKQLESKKQNFYRIQEKVNQSQQQSDEMRLLQSEHKRSGQL